MDLIKSGFLTDKNLVNDVIFLLRLYPYLLNLGFAYLSRVCPISSKQIFNRQVRMENALMPIVRAPVPLSTYQSIFEFFSLGDLLRFQGLSWQVVELVARLLKTGESNPRPHWRVVFRPAGYSLTALKRWHHDATDRAAMQMLLCLRIDIM